MNSNCLHKAERLNRKLIINRLFTGGAKSFSVYPLRIVYIPVSSHCVSMAEAAILVSVSKKRFKRAVKRNRIKRQVREAYRKNKHNLLDALRGKDLQLAIAFMYLGNEFISSAEMEIKMNVLLTRLIEKIIC
jgi:ribonuclease P protein component